MSAPQQHLGCAVVLAGSAAAAGAAPPCNAGGHEIEIESTAGGGGDVCDVLELTD